MKLKVLFFSLFKIVERQGSPEPPIGVQWLANRGIRIPKKLDFYAICFFVPFIFSVGYGVLAQAEMFDKIYGLNLLPVSGIFVSLLIAADYYHGLNYFHVNLGFFKVIPISKSKAFSLKLLVELLGYKFYLLFCAITVLAFFNHAYVEGISYYVHPKTLILLLDIYLLYVLLSMSFRNFFTIAIHKRWAEFLLRLISIIIVIALLGHISQFVNFKEYLSLKSLYVMNEKFWSVHLAGFTFILSICLAMLKLQDWKK